MVAGEGSRAELNVFAFDGEMAFADQEQLVRQLRALRRRMRGLSLCRYYRIDELDRWIEHLVWLEDGPAFADDITPVEAQATLARLLERFDNYELF